jgi:hypothetical protein
MSYTTIAKMDEVRYTKALNELREAMDAPVLPSFCAMLTLEAGWWVICANGDVYWNEYLVGSRRADQDEQAGIIALYNARTELFQTDNKKH